MDTVHTGRPGNLDPHEIRRFAGALLRGRASASSRVDGGFSDYLGLRGAIDRVIAHEQSTQLPSVPLRSRAALPLSSLMRTGTLTTAGTPKNTRLACERCSAPWARLL